MKPANATRFFNSKINENGRIVIPMAARQQLNLKPGETVVMELDDGVLRLESHHTHIRRLQQEFSKPAEPRQMRASEQRIGDRPQETIQETEEWLG
jgi:AbrB family looped-hinge helix DNA binding protein